MCQRFERNDEQYLEWLDQHPAGFVFNDFSGQRVLHCASCTHLRRDADTGRRTVYPKICCTSYDCIRTTVTTAYGAERHGWAKCGALGANCFA